MRMRVPALILLLASTTLPAEAGSMFTWGVQLSTPQVVSASGGIVIGRVSAPPRPPDAPPPKKMHIPSGLLLQLEPGLGGGKLAAGFVKGLPPVAAGGLKVFYLRTWVAPLWAEKN